MNYMEKVAQILGVEMKEKFKIEDFEDCNFYISEKGLQSSRLDLFCSSIFADLIMGRYKITKIPQQEHTGLEDVDAGQNVYLLFGARDGIRCPQKTVNGAEWFTDKYIRDNWERYIDIKKRLAKAASELNTEPIDWDNKNQEKWYFFYDGRPGGGFKFGHSYLLNNDSIYFTSKEAAQKAVEMVGTTDLFWAFQYFQAFIGYLKEVTADEQKTF